MKYLNFFLLVCTLILVGGVFLNSPVSRDSNVTFDTSLIGNTSKIKKSIYNNEIQNADIDKSILKQPSTITKPTFSEPSLKNAKDESLLPMNEELRVLVDNLDQNPQGKNEKNQLISTLKNAKNYRQLVLKKAKEKNKETKY